MTRNARSFALFTACGLAAGIATTAQAQPTLINISGSTLFESFFKSPASTTDYIDVDGDGCSRGGVVPCDQQLAPGGLPYPGNAWWSIHYRETGSVAGLQELINYGSVFVFDGATGSIAQATSSLSFLDRTQFWNGSAGQGPYNAANPGGCPVRENTTTLYATYPGAPTDGIRMDLAPLDIPTLWAVQNTSAGGAGYGRDPGQGGYGTNARTSVNRQGTSTNAAYPNTLAALGPRNLYDPNNSGAADSNTIFDTTVAMVPVAIVTNLGTGVSQMTQSELRHLFATGRRLNGENLHAITRDSGSGTRDAAMSAIGLDPSWGVGDNVGGHAGVSGSVLPAEHILGASFVPNNKIASGDMETTVINDRLGIGYAGAERGVTKTWLTGGKLEIVGVKADLQGGSSYIRPTMAALLHNSPTTGYVVFGAEQFASLGDPQAAPVNKGGTNNGHPQIPNVEAAAYLNNITASVAAFVDLPGGAGTAFTPGEYLATTYVLLAATNYVHSLTAPLTFLSNSALNTNLQTWINNNNTIFNDPGYATFGHYTLNGKVPTRATGFVYSDGVTNGNNYINQAGSAVNYGSILTDRNRIAGDFNGDGVRDINDALEMLKAYWSQHGGPAWVPPAGTGAIAGAPGSDAVIEILGDFNGDGNFDMADIRYWVDGLGIDPNTGQLNRFKAFKAIDDAWQTLTGSNNFFGTTIASGKPYVSGYSCMDVAGSGGAAPGWMPVGADGVIDAQDAAYIQAQFIGNPAVTDGHANWNNLSEAVAFDLSCDITGDLVVDQADLDFINAVLCYPNCDNSTTPPTLNVLDFSCFLNAFAAGNAYANCDHSTTPPVLNVLDFSCFLNKFAAGCQ